MNVLEWKLNVKTFFSFLPGAIWWTVLREGIEFTLNLFMHVVIGRMRGRAEQEDMYAVFQSANYSQGQKLGSLIVGSQQGASAKCIYLLPLCLLLL